MGTALSPPNNRWSVMSGLNRRNLSKWVITLFSVLGFFLVIYCFMETIPCLFSQSRCRLREGFGYPLPTIYYWLEIGFYLICLSSFVLYFLGRVKWLFYSVNWVCSLVSWLQVIAVGWWFTFEYHLSVRDYLAIYFLICPLMFFLFGLPHRWRGCG